jgi:hypothetical protein
VEELRHRKAEGFVFSAITERKSAQKKISVVEKLERHKLLSREPWQWCQLYCEKCIYGSGKKQNES